MTQQARPPEPGAHQIYLAIERHRGAIDHERHEIHAGMRGAAQRHTRRLVGAARSQIIDLRALRHDIAAVHCPTAPGRRGQSHVLESFKLSEKGVELLIQAALTQNNGELQRLHASCETASKHAKEELLKGVQLLWGGK